MGTGVPEDEQAAEPRAQFLSMVTGLREKQVFRFAAAYGVAAWLIVQVTATIAPAFDLPLWFLRAVIVAAVLGFIATMSIILLRQTVQRSASARTMRGSLVLGLGLVGLLLVIGGLGFIARNVVMAAERVTLAVLPFADMSPGHDKGYLADGVAEEILSALGKNRDIKVIGRTTSWGLRNRAADPAALRASLGITHLLEGSVRSAGQDLRLSVRLIRTQDGTEEWAENYSGTSGDIFALQDKVAVSVARRLNASPGPNAPYQSELTSSEAYGVYLAARQIARTRDEPHLRQAFAMAQKVVAAAPSYAPGHALLAETSILLSDANDAYGHIPFEKARPFGILEAQKAITLAPRLADGYAALGLALHDHDAIEPLRRAIKLDPSRSDVRLWLAIQLDTEDRYADAIALLRQAAELDPLFPAVISRLVFDLAAAGRPDEANQAISRYQAQGGDPAQLARMHLNVAVRSGDLSETVRWGEQALRLNSHTPYVPRFLTKAYQELGLPERQAAVPRDTSHAARYALYTGGYAAAIAAGGDISGATWNRSDFDFYVFALGAQREFTKLATLFDLHPGAETEICRKHIDSVPPFIAALRQSNRASDALPLMDCLKKRLAGVQLAGPRNPQGGVSAQWLALDAKPDQAVAALNTQIGNGWYELSDKLDAYPAFDSLKGRPDFASVQVRLNSVITRERRETIAVLKGRLPPSALR